MNPCLLLPTAFTLRYSSIAENTVSIGLMSSLPFGTCPLCMRVSRKVHSYYERKVNDLPMSGKPVSLRISVRKFFCQQQNCRRKIFAERFDSCLQSYQRRLERSNTQIRGIGLSCGSKPGAKVCGLIGLPVSASTVLRVMKKTPLPEVVTPKVLGIDDFAFRKGNTYGTILVDLEQRKPIDLLPDREGETLQEWLKAHPGVEVVTRDRSAVYAHAVTTAAPTAIQVADRWHLLKNLSENLERYLDTQRSLIKEVAQELSQKQTEALVQSQNNEQWVTLQDSTSSNLGNIGIDEKFTQEPTEKRYPIYQQVKLLQQQGYSRRAIARHMGLSRNTVNRYFRQESFVAKTKCRRSNLLQFEPYLRKRWAEGETCVKNF